MVGQLIGSSAEFDNVTVSNTTPTTIWAGRAPKVGIQIVSLDANTGLIYIGNSDVNVNRYPLAPGKSLFVPIDNVAGLRALAAVNGEAIAIMVI